MDVFFALLVMSGRWAGVEHAGVKHTGLNTRERDEQGRPDGKKYPVTSRYVYLVRDSVKLR